MSGLAQTHLQLMAQLRAAGWGGDDLARVVAAHDLAAQLHSAQVRPSGKPFVCHLVGTASATARHADRAELVLAALLHAAYDAGDFGHPGRPLREADRAEVRAVIGDAAEALVFAYDDWRWFPDGLEQVLTADHPTPAERDLALLRLANEVDDLADEAVARSVKAEAAEHHPDAIAQMVALADRLGFHRLVPDLRPPAGDGPRSALVPGWSAVLLPRSARLRVGAQITRATTGLRRRLRRS